MKIDFINAIYQHCLYNKKLNDRQIVEENGINDFDESLQKKLNRLDEDQLILLWQHFIDTMGGKSIDNQLQDISKENFYIAVGAFILSILSIIISIWK